MAEHVCHVHRTGEAPTLVESAEGPNAEGERPVPVEAFRMYISEAKKHQPLVPDYLVEYLTHAYTDLRKGRAIRAFLFPLLVLYLGDLTTKDTTYTTARTLLAILRLSQAMVHSN